MKFEVQTIGDVRIRPLLVRKADVQPNRLATRFRGAAIGSLHDAGAAA